MTKSDKIEIDSLVRQVEELKSAADKASAKYVDAKTFGYAQQALDDFKRGLRHFVDRARERLNTLERNAESVKNLKPYVKVELGTGEGE